MNVGAGQQMLGRERRERVSQLTWCSAGCFDSRRRVNSTVIPSPLFENMAADDVRFIVEVANIARDEDYGRGCKCANLVARSAQR